MTPLLYVRDFDIFVDGVVFPVYQEKPLFYIG